MPRSATRHRFASCSFRSSVGSCAVHDHQSLPCHRRECASHVRRRPGESRRHRDGRRRRRRGGAPGESRRRAEESPRSSTTPSTGCSPSSRSSAPSTKPLSSLDKYRSLCTLHESSIKQAVRHGRCGRSVAVRTARLSGLAFAALTLLVVVGGVRVACAQQPFIVDDAEVTAPADWHLEVSNHVDWLKREARPFRWQNTLEWEMDYGLARRMELSALCRLSASCRTARCRARQRSGSATPASP